MFLSSFINFMLILASYVIFPMGFPFWCVVSMMLVSFRLVYLQTYLHQLVVQLSKTEAIKMYLFHFVKRMTILLQALLC